MYENQGVLNLISQKQYCQNGSTENYFCFQTSKIGIRQDF